MRISSPSIQAGVEVASLCQTQIRVGFPDWVKRLPVLAFGCVLLGQSNPAGQIIWPWIDSPAASGGSESFLFAACVA